MHVIASTLPHPLACVCRLCCAVASRPCPASNQDQTHRPRPWRCTGKQSADSALWPGLLPRILTWCPASGDPSLTCLWGPRLMRAFTKKEKLIKFSGCYHGHADAFLVAAGSGVATLNLPDSPGVLQASVGEPCQVQYTVFWTGSKYLPRWDWQILVWHSMHTWDCMEWAPTPASLLLLSD